jgi:hypothetical protein
MTKNAGRFRIRSSKKAGWGGGAKRYLRSPGEHLRREASALQGCILVKGFSTLYRGVFSEVEHLVRDLPNPQGSSYKRDGQRRDLTLQGRIYQRYRRRRRDLYCLEALYQS